MDSLNALSFVIVYYHNNGKMVRIPFNGVLGDDPIELINQYWINNDQTFYSKATIEYNLTTIYTVDFN
jgi:hypothetical protein